MRSWSALLLVCLACGSPRAFVPADAAITPDLADAGAVDAGQRDGGVPDGGAEPRDSGQLALGATVTPSGVTFRVWAPHASAAQVEGDFPGQPVTMHPDPGGCFAVDVADAGAGTHYRFTFRTGATSITRTDPRCRQLLDATTCVVIDPFSFRWHDASFVAAPRALSVVYELHVGSFAVDAGAPSGTFSAARGRLGELADLGVNVVELMPANAFGGNPNGWGYNPQLIFAPKPSYGSADELRAFVDEAHRLGIAVWLDVVVNHLDGWRNAPLACFDGWCPGSTWSVYTFPAGTYATTPWGPRPNYDEPQVAQLLLDSTRAWLDEFHLDGFRWDSTSNIRALDGAGTVPGGRELLQAANALTHAHGGLAVAEDLKGWDELTKASSSGGFGFDAQWDSFGWDVANLLVPASDDGRDVTRVERSLRGGYAGDGFARLLWTENHDTVGNGGARLPDRIDGANPASFAARRRSMLAGVMLLTTPGVPMLFMGQESLTTGTFPDPPPPLPAPTPTGRAVREFWKDLIALRRNLDGGAAGLSEGDIEVLHLHTANKVIAYRRSGPTGEDVIVVLNLRNRAYTRYDIGVPTAGPWRVRLDSDWRRYGDDFRGGQTGPLSTLAQPYDRQPFTLPLELGAYGALVLTR